MTGSVYVVVALFLGVLLYLVLRRRSRQLTTGSPGSMAQSSDARADSSLQHSTQTSQQSVEGDFLRPATLTNAMPPVTRPRSSSKDSGSSHPAYPVAPATYAEYTPKSASVQRREMPQAAPALTKAASPAPSKAPLPEAQTSTPSAKQSAPWYPEPPADYTEAGGSESGAVNAESIERRTHS